MLHVAGARGLSTLLLVQLLFLDPSELLAERLVEVLGRQVHRVQVASLSHRFDALVEVSVALAVASSEQSATGETVGQLVVGLAELSSREHRGLVVAEIAVDHCQPGSDRVVVLVLVVVILFLVGSLVVAVYVEQRQGGVEAVLLEYSEGLGGVQLQVDVVVRGGGGRCQGRDPRGHCSDLVSRILEG